MIKEPKSVDFYTTGRQLSEQDFARISEWIRQKKEKANKTKKHPHQRRSTSPNSSNYKIVTGQ